MVALYKGDIWDGFREFMNCIMAITELLKFCFCENFFVFDNSENDFIYYVGTMLGQKGRGIKKPP
jgi:hypothetical protein